MSEDKTYRIIKLLEEILKWTRFQGWRSVKDVLSDALKDDISKLVYHYSDGSCSSRDIAEKVSISHVTVIRYWDKWSKIGIVEPIKVRGGGTRYKKMFSLEEFGIEIPEIKKTREGEAHEQGN